MSETSTKDKNIKFKLRTHGTVAAYLYLPHYKPPSGATIDVNAAINNSGRYQVYLDVDEDGNIVGVEVLDNSDSDDG